MNDTQESAADVAKRWINRRWMAWITFIFDHLLIMYIVVYTPAIQAYESIINTFFMLSGAVLSAYIGFSTWDDINKKKAEIGLEKAKIDNSAAFVTPSQNQSDERG